MYDDELDPEGPSPEDLERFGSDLCPECGADVYHEATICHVCGYALGTQADAPQKQNLWVGVVVAVALVALVLVFVL